MAITIRPTPVLSGTDAEKFIESISKSSAVDKSFEKEISIAQKILAKAKAAKEVKIKD